jgi:hypothetical protein
LALDRRKTSSFSVRALLKGGNRKLVRRKEDRKRIFYVDQYSSGLFFAIAAILFLCVVDAFLTLSLIRYGIYDINPVMGYFLHFGPYTFFIFKYLFTIIPVIFLLIFGNLVRRLIRVSSCLLLYLMAGFYLVVVAFELYLVFAMVNCPAVDLPLRHLPDTTAVLLMDPSTRPSIQGLEILHRSCLLAGISG